MATVELMSSTHQNISRKLGLLAKFPHASWDTMNINSANSKPVLIFKLRQAWQNAGFLLTAGASSHQDMRNSHKYSGGTFAESFRGVHLRFMVLPRCSRLLDLADLVLKGFIDMFSFF